LFFLLRGRFVFTGLADINETVKTMNSRTHLLALSDTLSLGFLLFLFGALFFI
jgi:hypothetical protein